MSRCVMLVIALSLLPGAVRIGWSQSVEPRGRTFSEGGGWRHAPREHHVTIPVHQPYWYDYGTPWGYPLPPVYHFGGGFNGGNPLIYGSVVAPGYYLPYPQRMSEMPNSPLTPPPDALPVQRSPWEQQPLPRVDPALKPVLPSSAASRARALDYLASGDQHLRQQLWQHAYANYRQATNLADDLAEAHLRYGIILAMLNRYDRAAAEFRRAAHVDPSIAQAELTLASLFGPESRIVRASLLSRTGHWVDEDLEDPDRLFVMGVLLHFNQDQRAQTLLSAAAELSGQAEHVVAFLPREDQAEPGAPAGRGELKLPPAPLPPPVVDDVPPAGLPIRPRGDSRLSPPRPNLGNPRGDGPVLLPPVNE